MALATAISNSFFNLPDYSINPPADLLSLVLPLKKVQRYVQDDYPTNVIIDFTYYHEFRGVKTIRGIRSKYPALKVDWNKAERGFWIHDIVELGMAHDITTILAHRRPDISKLKAESENKRVIELLNPDDQKLFKHIEIAGKAIKGNGEWNNVTPEALIDYVVDKTDSNMCFHYWVSKSDKKFPPDSLLYTLSQYSAFMSNLEKCPLKEVKTVAIDLLNEEIQFVRDQWSSRPTGFAMPQEISKFLQIK